jgi:hypothetical protein
MSKAFNQRGFIPVLVLIVLAVSVVALTGWRVLTAGDNVKPTTTYVDPGSTPPPASNTGLPHQSSCETGRIIIYFKSDVSEPRQKQIIAAEKFSIHREYSAFDGYALIVEKGREAAAAQVFLKYSEIKYAGSEGCPGSTNSPDAAN